MSEKKLASDYFMEGLNCAESVVQAYKDEFNQDIPLRVASGLGGGCGAGSLCGAVNGACICSGFTKGRDKVGEENVAKPYSKQIIEKVRETYGSVDCKALKKDRVGCKEIVDFAYETLKEVLK